MVMAFNMVVDDHGRELRSQVDWWCCWWYYGIRWAAALARPLSDSGRGDGPVMAYGMATEWVFIVWSTDRSLSSRSKSLDVVDW